MLSVNGVNSYYHKFHALKDASLSVAEGEIVSVIGANGAGKSTLLKTICGLIKPRRGSISLREEEISQYTVEKIISLGVCMVPEGREIFTDLSVKENLELGAFYRYKRGEKNDIVMDMDRVLEMFPVLKERIHQKGGTLSGGEQQMLAIGRGIMSRPELLLLDEPSLGLAPMLVEFIFETIANLRDRGLTILLVEQNSNMSLMLSDRGYVMQTGSIILEDMAENLLKNEEVRNLYLGKKAYANRSFK